MSSSPFEAVLADYRTKASAEAAWLKDAPLEQVQARRDELFLHVGDAEANFLRALAVAHKAQVIVELGTSLGFSTLYLADAARQTGGKVVTYELNAGKQSYARQQLETAGLADYVEWHCGDAIALLGELDRKVDFAFVDLWKDLYVASFHALLPHLAMNALVAADNMLLPAFARPDAQAYRAAVLATGEFSSVLLPVGQGIELSCKNLNLANARAAA